MLADSHCHILDPKLKDKVSQIVDNLKNDGLEFIVEISADPNEAKEALAFATAHKNVYCTIGVHPCNAGQYDDEFERWCVGVKSKKVVAFGECGLDYYHKDCPVDIQKQVFIKSIKLANKLGLPLVVHSRDAFEDTYKILKENKKHLNNGLLIHCFSYGAAEVRAFAELDAFFAFGGAVTYKNNKISDDAIRAVAKDRILIETDCPYLSPEPNRGKVNEPKNVKLVAAYIMRIINLTEKEILDNTKRFYRI